MTLFFLYNINYLRLYNLSELKILLYHICLTFYQTDSNNLIKTMLFRLYYY